MSKRSMLRIAPVVLGLGLSMAVGVPSAIAADAVSASEIVAEPKNNTDKYFHFYMASTGNTSGTGYRKKDDATSVYVYVKYSRGEPRIFVDGAMNDKGASHRDCTAANYRVAGIGEIKQRRMRNYVNEWGYSHARITSWADRGTSEIEGDWSPDSNPNAGYAEMPYA